MRAYLITTAVIFAAIIVAHIWRIFSHEWNAITQPDFIIATAAAVALLAWALVLIKRGK